MDPAHLPPLRLKVMDDGALQLRGDLSKIRVVDGEGHPFDFGEHRTVLLCRCGQSQNKPFCDSSHLRTGFISSVRVDRQEPLPEDSIDG
ncbi:MAG: CDGSH iron-sulfur domain-containing protein [Chloroflexota bacterium]|nr:CDGSH iron-sulfur domain-containing protein [Chloroflexota bacterium]